MTTERPCSRQDWASWRHLSRVLRVSWLMCSYLPAKCLRKKDVLPEALG